MTPAYLAMTFTASLIAGGTVWTGAEYGAHRWAMHATGGRGPVAKEHLTHHAKPARTRTPVRIAAHISMTLGVIVVAWLATRWLPIPVVVGVAIGFWLGYLAYEHFHFRAHHYPPLGRRGSVVHRWDLALRRRHFHHHFVAPKKNMGVLVASWDRLFGTEADPQPIIVPRRLAMSWLVDDDGRVLDEYADTYAIAGVRRLDTAQQDRDVLDAFANRPPAVD